MFTRRQTNGFTLLEAMTVVALIGIVTTLAAPMMSSLIASSRLSSSTNDIVGSLAIARSSAVRLNRMTRIAPLVGTDWSTGYQVTEAGLDTVLGTADDQTIVQFEAIDPTLTVTRSVAYNNLDFRADGTRPVGSAVITVSLCGLNMERVVTISAMGSVSTVRGAC